MRVVATLLTAAVLLTACGDGDGDPSASPAPPVPTETVTVTVTPDPPDSPAPTSTATAAPACRALEDGESLAFLFVTQPRVGASVSPGFQVMGCGNLFEASFQWELLSRDGEVLAEGNGTATCGTGCVGEFAFSVSYDSPAERQVGTLRVFASSPQDGSEQHVNAIPVVLQPSG